MYKLTATDETPLFSQEAQAKLKALPKAVLSMVKTGAAYERDHHAYRNRTGDLQRSTQGSLMRSSASDIRASLTMDMPYASYVVNKGLSDITTVAKDVEEQLNAFLESYFAPGAF